MTQNTQLIFNKLDELSASDYDKTKSVLDYDLAQINKFLSLGVWEAFNITSSNVSLLLVWKVRNGFLVLLSVVGYGLKYVEKAIKDIAHRNGLGIEIPTHSKVLVRLYRKFGFSINEYILRLD